MKYAYTFETLGSIEEDCSNFIWNYFADSVPSYLDDCIDYTKYVKSLGVEVLYNNDKVLFLSEKEVDDMVI